MPRSIGYALSKMKASTHRIQSFQFNPDMKDVYLDSVGLKITDIHEKDLERLLYGVLLDSADVYGASFFIFANSYDHPYMVLPLHRIPLFGIPKEITQPMYRLTIHNERPPLFPEGFHIKITMKFAEDFTQPFFLQPLVTIMEYEEE